VLLAYEYILAYICFVCK